MSYLRVGGLTHVTCDSCGHRYRVKSLVPDDSVGTWVELKCIARHCGQMTAMAISSYRAYSGVDRHNDIQCSKR